MPLEPSSVSCVTVTRRLADIDPMHPSKPVRPWIYTVSDDATCEVLGVLVSIDVPSYEAIAALADRCNLEAAAASDLRTRPKPDNKAVSEPA